MSVITRLHGRFVSRCTCTNSACRDGGWILRASNGQFHATRSVEADDVAYPRDLRATSADSIEDIAAQWSRIAQPTVEPRR